MKTPTLDATQRLDGLDLARFAAFVGMVIVNFEVVMGASGQRGLLGLVVMSIEGRAAATFVTLAGVGLGLATAQRRWDRIRAVTLRRAVFLLVVGLLDSIIFQGDILHFYAFYFVAAVAFMRLRDSALVASIAGLMAGFVVLALLFDYGRGWDFATLDYVDFWTPAGFLRICCSTASIRSCHGSRFSCSVSCSAACAWKSGAPRPASW